MYMCRHDPPKSRHEVVRRWPGECDSSPCRRPQGVGVFPVQKPSHDNFFKRFYLFIHERHTEREAETQAERDAGSQQGAQCGTRSQEPGITP